MLAFIEHEMSRTERDAENADKWAVALRWIYDREAVTVAELRELEAGAWKRRVTLEFIQRWRREEALRV